MPGEPSQFEVDGQTEEAITLSWGPVDDCKKNGVIRSYTMSYICTEVDRTDVGKNNLKRLC